MKTIYQKKIDFQKLRQTTKRINKLVRFAKVSTPEQILEMLSVEISHVEQVLPTVEHGIVKEWLNKFHSTLKFRYQEVSRNV